MAKVTSYDAATGGGATDCVVRAYPWVHQLAGAQRGAIHGSHDAIGSKVFAQAWGLDATGNWSTFDDDPDGDGDWDLQQTRTASTRQTASSAVEPESLQPKYQYVWSPRYIDAPILRDENTDADALCDDSRLYYLADANFNVTALVDTTGAVVERYLYAPYGTVTILDPTFAADNDGLSDVSNVTLYTGRELDAATGLYYYRARYYDSALGVFVGRDPIGYKGGVSLYEYVAGNPIQFRDPGGLETTPTEAQTDYLIVKCRMQCPISIKSEAPKALNRAFELLLTEQFHVQQSVSLSPMQLANGEDPLNAEVWPDELTANGILVPNTRPQRAMRHCIASGLLAMAVGCKCAERVGTNREMFNYLYGAGYGTGGPNVQQSIGATQRALTNNRQGRLCAGCSGKNASWTPRAFEGSFGGYKFPKTERDIVNCCKDALYSGAMMQTNVVPPGVTLPTLPTQPPLGTGPSYTSEEQSLIWLAHHATF